MVQKAQKYKNLKDQPRRHIEAAVDQPIWELETERKQVPHFIDEIITGEPCSIGYVSKMLHAQRSEAVLALQQTHGNRCVQRFSDQYSTPYLGEDIMGTINARRGSGKPLGHEARSDMEIAFRHDFSKVMIHTDHNADILSKKLGAKAFTVGEDIFFKKGKYQPGSETGVGLIAHELAHVVQQAAGQKQLIPQLMPDIAPEVEREIQDWLKKKKDLLIFLKPESIRRQIIDQIASSKGLTDDELQGLIDRWRLRESIASGITPSPAKFSTPEPAPGKETAKSSALSDTVRRITRVFARIPTQINIAGDFITIDTGGATAKLRAGKAVLTAAAGWTGSFQVGAVYKGSGALAAGQNVHLSAGVDDKNYSISLRIGPEVTAIDMLPGIVKNAENGLRGLLSDIGSLNLNSLDAVKQSIGQISNNVTPIKEAVDACSKIEGERTGKAPSVAFSLTAQFPREKGSPSVMGLFTFYF